MSTIFFCSEMENFTYCYGLSDLKWFQTEIAHAEVFVIIRSFYKTTVFALAVYNLNIFYNRMFQFSLNFVSICFCDSLSLHFFVQITVLF